jgi:hypothetical protein
MDGGGAGGGAVLGHLADGLEPLWPAPIRQWLPRWWTDRQLRRQMTLTNTADNYTRRLDAQTRATNQLLENYQNLDIAQRKPLQTAVDTACLNDIDVAIAQYDNLVELLPLSHGRKRLQIEAIQSRCAWIVVDRAVQRVTVARDRLLEHLNRIDALVAESDAVPPTRPLSISHSWPGASGCARISSRSSINCTRSPSRPDCGTTASATARRKPGWRKTWPLSTATWETTPITT